MATAALPQTSASFAPAVCTVELDANEALGVAFTLRSLVHEGRMHPSSAAVYDRVAKQLKSAALLALKSGGRP